MGYYIRILGIQDPDIHLDELLENLKADGPTAKIAFAEVDTPDKWTLLEVANDNGDTLAQIERDPVVMANWDKKNLMSSEKKWKTANQHQRQNGWQTSLTK